MRGPFTTSGGGVAVLRRVDHAGTERVAGQPAVGEVAVHEHLGEQADDVHPEPVDAAVEPAVHHRVDGLPDLGVLPVEVGLLGGEQVQVVLARLGVVGPRRSRERRAPVGRLRTRRTGLEALARWSPPVPVALGVVLRRPRLLEPRVRGAGVVDDQVHDQLHPALVQGGDQLVELVEGAEERVDVLVVADVVAVVGHRRLVDRAQPHDVDAETLEVVEALDDAAEVAHAVAVAVGEAAGVHLVDDGRLPPVAPGRVDGSHGEQSCGSRRGLHEAASARQGGVS